MSKSKAFQKWTNDLISRLQSAWGLELEEIRKNKYKIVKGTINGKPYQQRFSSTPKSPSSASASIRRETKRKLLECGVDIDEINKSMPGLAFMTYKSLKKEGEIKQLVRLLTDTPTELLEEKMVQIDIESFMKELQKNYVSNDQPNDQSKLSAQLAISLDALQNILIDVPYERLSEEFLDFNTGQTLGNINLIPANGQSAACNKFLLAIANGSGSRKTGFTSVMRQVRGHLINCYGDTKIVVLFTDIWDKRKFEESRLDIEAHRREGVVFLTGLVTGDRIIAAPLPF